MKERFDFTDYDIRIWGSTTFITNRYKIDYAIDKELGRLGIQDCNLDCNQKKKAIELCDKVVEAIRNLDEYLNDKRGV